LRQFKLFHRNQRGHFLAPSGQDNRFFTVSDRIDDNGEILSGGGVSITLALRCSAPFCSYRFWGTS